jgi:hypothetical protein
MLLGAPVTVYLFDGSTNDDVGSWMDRPDLVGKRVFSSSRSGGAVYNGRSAGLKVGAISLTDALIDRVQSGRLGGLGNKEVTWYLKQNLNWKVIKVSNSLFTLLRLRLTAIAL